MLQNTVKDTWLAPRAHALLVPQMWVGRVLSRSGPPFVSPMLLDPGAVQFSCASGVREKGHKGKCA